MGDVDCDNSHCIDGISRHEIHQENTDTQEKKMIVTITGTPGAGKTYISRKLTNFDYIDLNRIIKEERLYDSYDRKDKTYDVDVKKLKKLWKRFGKYKEKPLKV